MIDMTDKEKIERLKLFLKEKTYTYIFDIFEYHFNGYVKDLDKNKILFLDDVLGKIPIRIAEIKVLTTFSLVFILDFTQCLCLLGRPSRLICSVKAK